MIKISCLREKDRIEKFAKACYITKPLTKFRTLKDFKRIVKSGDNSLR